MATPNKINSNNREKNRHRQERTPRGVFQRATWSITSSKHSHNTESKALWKSAFKMKPCPFFFLKTRGSYACPLSSIFSEYLSNSCQTHFNPRSLIPCLGSIYMIPTQLVWPIPSFVDGIPWHTFGRKSWKIVNLKARDFKDKWEIEKLERKMLSLA